MRPSGDLAAFGRLVMRRWLEACAATGLNPSAIALPWDIGPYEHFRKRRGYAVAIDDGKGSYHMRFAAKTLKAPRHRQDGLVRHELGHVVDYLVPRKRLDAWAKARGVTLARTDERRADDIARAVWGVPLRYDTDDVQSTRFGVTPRPIRLGA